MITNSIGRNIPKELIGYKKVIPFAGAFNHIPEGNLTGRTIRRSERGQRNKLVTSFREIFELAGLKDGMSISFHHHLRNGDRVINETVNALAECGFKDLTLVPTALFGVHKELIKHIESGVITGIYGSVNGPIGRRVTEGVFSRPVVLRSHGGRARAMMSGELKVDLAFIAAPAADHYGNMTGRFGQSACGAIGYAMTDADYAETVVVVTDNLVDYPLAPASIKQDQVDYVMKVDKIGDPEGIVSGTTRVTKDPARLRIGHYAARLIAASGLIKDGFSFQTGAGGASLAGASFVREIMKEKQIKGSFASGGITSYFVEMQKEGLFQTLYDVQSFDLDAVASIGHNNAHVEMSASMYGNPNNGGCVVNQLDAVILGATEVDINFNVNVNTEADGALLHGIGGHMDTAAGAELTIIAAPLFRGRVPLVRDNVITVTSPGETIDAIITERGIAINPVNEELIGNARRQGLPLLTIEELKETCEKICGKQRPVEFNDRIIGIIEYRDGTIIDVVRQPVSFAR
jgi:citrate lyase subunit alpha/citrate CoA-transferase